MRILLVFSFVVLISCGNEPASVPHEADMAPAAVVIADTPAEDTVAVEALALKMSGDTIAPPDQSQIFFSFNAALMNKKGKVLSGKEVRRRFTPLDPECDGELTYKLRQYLLIDSLKKRGEEPDHDMGQIVWAEVKLLDTIRKNENGCWVTWRLDYETAQACPYASGTLFILTTYDKTGKQISTQCMARDEGGADAPISWTCHEYCNIFNDGSFRSLYADSTEDYDVNDQPVYSVMRKTFTGQISAAGKITRTESEIERTE